MTKAADPYYNRKPVPAEFTKDVGYTGMTPEEEFLVRENKYTAHGGADLRRFDMSKHSGFKPESDPYYGRKSIDASATHGIGVTGLTPQQEWDNRERKYSVNGVDIRKFSNSATGGMEPLNDPYYGRKQVSGAETHGVGELDITPAEVYENRERKQSLFQLSGDPFAELTGRGNRQSISEIGGAHAAAETRRRSSAGQGGAAAAAVAAHNKSHSGYNGHHLEPIVSRAEASNAGESAAGSSTVAGSDHHHHPTTNDTTTAPITKYDYVDPDSVAPDEVR